MLRGACKGGHVKGGRTHLLLALSHLTIDHASPLAWSSVRGVTLGAFFFAAARGHSHNRDGCYDRGAPRFFFKIPYSGGLRPLEGKN